MADDEWVSNAETAARSREVLERIAQRQERFPVCPCGQRTANPSGICSKKTDAHRALVAEAEWSR